MFRISGKNLAELNLPDTCPNCFKIRIELQNEKKIDKKSLPFQMPFPGIFSVFDSHVKNVIDHHFKINNSLPGWFPDLGEKIIEIPKAPGWRNFSAVFEEYGIEMTGALDVVFKLEDGTFIFGDYKTASITQTQDNLLPLYEAQLHAYINIAKKRNLFQPVKKLVLIYTEPVSHNHTITPSYYLIEDFKNKFHIHFNVVAKHLSINLDLTNILLKKLRAILDDPFPQPLPGCPNCLLRDRLHTKEASLKSYLASKTKVPV